MAVCLCISPAIAYRRANTAGSGTGRVNRRQAGKQHWLQSTIWQRASQIPELICRGRLADELQVRLISGRDSGGEVRGGKTPVAVLSLSELFPFTVSFLHLTKERI